eukprot:5584640-Pleurochrysis_carterae.AAC.2
MAPTRRRKHPNRSHDDTAEMVMHQDARTHWQKHSQMRASTQADFVACFTLTSSWQSVVERDLVGRGSPNA